MEVLTKRDAAAALFNEHEPRSPTLSMGVRELIKIWVLPTPTNDVQQLPSIAMVSPCGAGRVVVVLVDFGGGIPALHDEVALAQLWRLVIASDRGPSETVTVARGLRSMVFFFHSFGGWN